MAGTEAVGCLGKRALEGTCLPLPVWPGQVIQMPWPSMLLPLRDRALIYSLQVFCGLHEVSAKMPSFMLGHSSNIKNLFGKLVNSSVPQFPHL